MRHAATCWNKNKTEPPSFANERTQQLSALSDPNTELAFCSSASWTDPNPNESYEPNVPSVMNKNCLRPTSQCLQLTSINTFISMNHYQRCSPNHEIHHEPSAVALLHTAG